MPNFVSRRERMIERQIRRRGIKDAAVLRAMHIVPRERFVATHLQAQAYSDSPLSIGERQTISQPYIVALMVEAAAICCADRVLEVGAGSGYAAAVMSILAKRVYAIERQPNLVESARQLLQQLGYSNVDVLAGDGSAGWPKAAPFDAILVSAGAPRAPAILKRQLQIGGRLVMPVGANPYDQRLIKIIRTDENAYTESDLGAVSFVPMIGAYGWPEDTSV